MKYRKKPVEVEAFHYEAEKSGSEETQAYPQWLMAAFIEGTIYQEDDNLYIKTLEGTLTVSDGDWIIQGTKGELYPCKPDIFAEIYETGVMSKKDFLELVKVPEDVPHIFSLFGKAAHEMDQEELLATCKWLAYQLEKNNFPFRSVK